MSILDNFLHGLGLNFQEFIITCVVLILGMLLAGTLGRFIFGKRSVLSCSVSAAIAILFIYAITVVFSCSGKSFDWLIAPLPFVTIGDTCVYFRVLDGDFSSICANLLSMVILSFIVNLADSILPRGKNLFTWLLFRFLTVAISYLLHLLIVFLFSKYLPQVLITYAPIILLGVLIVLILTGALKLLVGVILATVNPIIAALYTFFFANFIGKHLTKALLSTILLEGIIILLNYLGIFAVSIASSVLIIYIPAALIVLLLWFLSDKIF